MNNSRTIALCIPAYNAELYLPRLLVSVEKQIIPFDEILVYNDCSKDNTKSVAESYGAKVINGDRNRGCSYGKNRMAQATSCEWIHFHDADDTLYPNFTSLAHAWISKIDCPDVILFDYEYRDFDNDNLISIRKFDKAQLEKDPIDYAIREQINPFCGLYKKEKFLKAGGYDLDEAVLYNENSRMHISLAIEGLTFSSESIISIINYRIGGSMSSANKAKCIIAQYIVQKKTIKSLAKKGSLENYSKSISKKLWEQATFLASIKHWKLMDECIENAKFLSPESRPEIRTGVINIIISIFPKTCFRIRENLIRILKLSSRL